MLKRSEITSIIYTTMIIEGGYANIRGDSGSHTMWGLASAYNPDFAEAIEKGELHYEDAILIYRYRYFNRFRLYDLESNKAFFLFQLVVNPDSVLIKTFQKYLNDFGGHLKVDGILGRNTIRFVKGMKSSAFLSVIKNILKNANQIATEWKKGVYASKLNVSINSRARRYMLNSFYTITGMYRQFDPKESPTSIVSTRKALDFEKLALNERAVYDQLAANSAMSDEEHKNV